MAALDLEEQEQIDALKHFWKDYGKLIVSAIVAFALGVGGVQGWKYYKRNQAAEASQAFIKLEEAQAKGDANEIRNVAGDIIDKYAGTAYGAMAALIVGKIERDAGDLDTAGKRFKWAVDNAASEELRMVSRLRLAAVQLDQKEFDAALKLLDESVTDAFVGPYSDLRGDVLLAQGKVAEARAAYEKALDKAAQSGTWRDVVQIKLDSLSGK